MLTGYQEHTDWMGTEVLTLADVWPSTIHVMVVGLNPAPISVASGHYYQGRSGQTQLMRLAAAGLFHKPKSGTYFEEAAVRAGVGFTDIVKRPSSGERQVTWVEIRHGADQLVDKLRRHDVRLVVCVFRHPVRVLLGAVGSPGMQLATTSWGAHVFRMPGPYAKHVDAQRVMDEFSAALPGLMEPRV